MVLAVALLHTQPDLLSVWQHEEVTNSGDRRLALEQRLSSLKSIC